MPRKSLPYVNTYTDRTGVVRSYFRKPGMPRIPIEGTPGTVRFMRAYNRLINPPKVQSVPKRRLRPPVGQIYYLSDGEHIKIGFTTDWNKRKLAFATYSARPLELLAIHPGTDTDEKKLHERFRQDRIRNEWFHQSPDIIDHIRRTLAELNAA